LPKFLFVNLIAKSKIYAMTLLDTEIKQRRLAFGACIKSLRLKANLSQEKLAQIAEIDRKSVSRIENGHLSPSIDILWAIADALKMDAYEILVPMAHGKLSRELELRRR
jgi:transcriptional regulator with XRE-family HTH domain